MAPQYKLSYFDVRALAEPIRLIFALKNIEFEDVRVTQEEWVALKPNSPWGSMPTLEFGGKILAQSSAIQRYLAKKYDLNGSDDFEAAKADELVEATVDIRKSVFEAYFDSNAVTKEENFKKLNTETFPTFLGKIEAILKANGGKFFVGKNVTYADLNVASYLQIFSELDVFPNLLDSFKLVKAHQETVFNLPGIKEWIPKRSKTQL